MTALRLRPLSYDDETAAREAHEELARDGFEFLLDERDGESWPEYVDRLERHRLGLDLSEGRVPATFLVAEVRAEIAGRLSVRHRLNAQLAEVGGHIGYGVRPGFRRLGCATEILRQALDLAREQGLERVLLTCDHDNTGSARTIERCGGVVEAVVPGHDGQPDKRRYWIDLG